ncbi:MAG: DNA-3-methyladenine glycosylase I [Castellaniella sp.]
MADTTPRCTWCSDDPLYMHYHDHEWGVPSYDAGYLFEMLLLEGFQAGLSWLTILRRREGFRKALASFDPHTLAATTPEWVEQQMQNPAIIRNRLKLQGVGKNARAWLALENPVELVWSVVDGKPKVHHYAQPAEIPTAGPEAQALSKLLKHRGFTFVGPTICQAYLQAIGALMDHTTDCFRHAMLDTSRLE